MSFTGDGIYLINHGHVAVRISLPKGSDVSGTPLVPWNLNDDYLYNMWLVVSVPNEADTYRIRNIVSGTYMDLTQSNPANGTLVIGYQKTNPGENQQWIIKKETSGTGFWKIQNKATNTFIDLLYGSNKDGSNSIVGWAGSWDDGSPSLGHQHWSFSPQSVRGGDIHTSLLTNPYLRQDFKSYISDGLYLILSSARLQDIWNNSGLQGRKCRFDIFDCDGFAFVYKAEVAKWGDANFKADGFSVLCGAMFGTSGQNEGHSAYNWMIDENNHSTIRFFEPQTGDFLEKPGFSANFGVF